VSTYRLAQRLRASESYAWGFVDQGVSSATNFGLVLLAARALGPGGLGVVTLGFFAYLLALGFQRSLLTTPLVSATSALEPAVRMLAIRRGLTIQLLGGLAATTVFLVLGYAVPGNAGRGVLLVTPWLAAALLQDFWRAVLFQEKRPRAAAGNDALWAGTMCIAALPALYIGSDWAIVGCWGAGALAGALLGFGQLNIRPAAAAAAISWWRERIWPFGSWLGLESAMYSVAETGTVFVLNGVLGASAVGGLRAAQSLFAPLNLILPAVTLPGLPAVARALAASPDAAIRLAARLSGFVAALAAVYVGVMILLGESLIPVIFGESFTQYETLAVPIGAWQLVAGAGAGFAIFLVAKQRGRDLVAIRVVGAGATLGLVSLLAWKYGVTGAAWGFAFGAGSASALTIALALRSYRASVRDRR
jgi:O-antigen/teichoic acid export membrane protein